MVWNIYTCPKMLYKWYHIFIQLKSKYYILGYHKLSNEYNILGYISSENVIFRSRNYMIYNKFFLHNRHGVQSSNYYSFFHFLTIKSIFYFQLLITTITKMRELMIQQPRTSWGFDPLKTSMKQWLPSLLGGFYPTRIGFVSK